MGLVPISSDYRWSNVYWGVSVLFGHTILYKLTLFWCNNMVTPSSMLYFHFSLQLPDSVLSFLPISFANLYLFTHHVSVYSHILVLQLRIHIFLEHGASSNKTILKGKSNSTFLQVKPKCRCFLVVHPKLVNLANNQTNIATYAYLSLVFALKSSFMSNVLDCFTVQVKHCSKFLALEELSLHWIHNFTKRKTSLVIVDFQLS